jgi:DNA-binding NarL/FixJ family response regulator
MRAQLPGEGPLTVALMSRHHVIRSGLGAVVRGTAGRAVALDAPGGGGTERVPDVAIFDVAGLAYPDSVADLRRVRRRSSVVALLREGRHDLERTAASLGLRHFIDEDVEPAALLAVLERAAGRRGVPQGDGLDGLTPREQEVLSLVGEGLNNRQISERLFVSSNTVKTYIRTAYGKIGVTDRSHAVLWAVEHAVDR